jgi:hypothetical protein
VPTGSTANSQEQGEDHFGSQSSSHWVSSGNYQGTQEPAGLQADGSTREQLGEDRQIRTLVFDSLNKEEKGNTGESRQNSKNKAGISNIDIERQPNQVHIIIDTARPG